MPDPIAPVQTHVTSLTRDTFRAYWHGPSREVAMRFPFAVEAGDRVELLELGSRAGRKLLCRVIAAPTDDTAATLAITGRVSPSTRNR